MAILVKGTNFTTGDQVSATNLDNLVDAATFDTGAVDNSTTALSGGAIIVKDAGVTMAKLASASNGQLPIGNGSGFTAATLTAGTGVTVTNASGAITVAVTGSVPVSARTTAQFDKTNTTLANITGLSANLTNGVSYTFESYLFVSEDDTGESKIALSGTATASSIIADVWHYVAGEIRQSTRITALDAAVTCTGNNTTTKSILIRGTLVASATGTLTVQYAQNSATGTSSVLIGSYLTVAPI